jgi:hypothetical protein
MALAAHCGNAMTPISRLAMNLGSCKVMNYFGHHPPPIEVRPMIWLSARGNSAPAKDSPSDKITIPFWRPDPREQRELGGKYAPRLMTLLAGRFMVYSVLRTYYPHEFREGARQAFFRVVELLNQRDIEGLRPLLGDELLQGICGTFEGLKEKGVSWELMVKEMLYMKVLGIHVRLGPAPRPHYTYRRFLGQEFVFLPPEAEVARAEYARTRAKMLEQKLKRPIPVLPVDEGHIQIHVAYYTRESLKLTGNTTDMYMGPMGIHVFKFESPLDFRQPLEDISLAWKITDMDYYISARKDSTQEEPIKMKANRTAPVENVIKSKENDGLDK